LDEELNNIELIIHELLDVGEIELVPSSDGLGLKAHLSDLVNDELEDGSIERLFVQLYVECLLSNNPSDPNIGYTSDDVITNSRILVAEVGSQTDPPEYIGEAFEKETFVEQFISNQSMRDELDTGFDKLLAMAAPKETWLAHVNSLYNDRIPGDNWITAKMKAC